MSVAIIRRDDRPRECWVSLAALEMADPEILDHCIRDALEVPDPVPVRSMLENASTLYPATPGFWMRPDAADGVWLVPCGPGSWPEDLPQ